MGTATKTRTRRYRVAAEGTELAIGWNPGEWREFEDAADPRFLHPAFITFGGSNGLVANYMHNTAFRFESWDEKTKSWEPASWHHLTPKQQSQALDLSKRKADLLQELKRARAASESAAQQLTDARAHLDGLKREMAEAPGRVKAAEDTAKNAAAALSGRERDYAALMAS